jgi:hypothetical protein
LFTGHATRPDSIRLRLYQELVRRTQVAGSQAAGERTRCVDLASYQQAGLAFGGGKERFSRKAAKT